jgi:flagellar basal body-associated protein FliL
VALLSLLADVGPSVPGGGSKTWIILVVVAVALAVAVAVTAILLTRRRGGTKPR